MKLKKIIFLIFFVYAALSAINLWLFFSSTKKFNDIFKGRLEKTSKIATLMLKKNLKENKGPIEIIETLSEIEKIFILENVSVYDKNGDLIYTTDPVKELLKTSLDDDKKELNIKGINLVLHKNKFFVNNRPYFFVIEAFSDLTFSLKQKYIIGLISLSIIFFTVLIITYILGKKLNRSIENEKRQEKLALLGKMSSIVAHEIRNPLGIIKSSAQLIQRKHKIEDELFDDIENEITELNNFVNETLNVSKKIKIEKTTCNLEELLKSVMNKFEDIQFSNGNIGTIKCDKEKLSQVISNLIINSQNHGKKPIEIETDSKDKSISIYDNGNGFDNKVLNRIFEPFFTTSSKGTGLGLYLCKEIIEAHGWKINASNRKKGGAKILIKIL